jgi:hypothetical protein
MPYKIAGIDVHKKMLHVVFSDVEVDGEYQFERRRFDTSPSQLRLLAFKRSTLPSRTRFSIISMSWSRTMEWWVGTGLEANFLGPSPLAEPAERISRNGLPRLHARDSDQTVRWRVESA